MTTALDRTAIFPESLILGYAPRQPHGYLEGKHMKKWLPLGLLALVRKQDLATLEEPQPY